MAKPTKEMLLEWYRQMTLIREFEETSHQLYFDKRITGVYMHLYSGHEAVAVGAMAHMEIGTDHIITAYRDHAQALIAGVDPNRIMAEMFGKKTGVSGGKGGSMHLASKEHNFWGGYAIVGGHLPLASGIALAAQYNNTGAVVLSHVGDGATNNGYFHEALNFAGLWDLPVIWLIENNGYGMGTETERAAGNPELHERAIGYDVKDFGRVDGQDVFKVYDVLGKAFEHCRSGGSALVEAITYRYRGHGVSDKQYDSRLADELEEWKEDKDPINILKKHLLEEYKTVSEGDLQAILDENRRVVAESVEFSENSEFPTTLEDLYSNVYTD